MQIQSRNIVIQRNPWIRWATYIAITYSCKYLVSKEYNLRPVKKISYGSSLTKPMSASNEKNR